jgi:hypothetical protein
MREAVGPPTSGGAVTKVVLVVAMIGLLACGNAVGSNPGGSSGPPCTFTLSGGTAGTYGCTIRYAIWSDTDDTGTVMFGYGYTGQTTPVISASFNFPGEPRPGTLTETSPDAGVTTRITVTSGSASWAATEAASTPTTGTYTLTVTNSQIVNSLSDRDVYGITGTLDATLPPVPQTSATGNVTLHLGF